MTNKTKIIEEFSKWIREDDVNLIDFLDEWQERMIREWLSQKLDEIESEDGKEINNAIKKLAKIIDFNHITPALQTTASMYIMAKQELEKEILGAVPEEKIPKEDSPFFNLLCAGWNDCRSQTLINLKKIFE